MDINRRDFLKTTAITAGILALNPNQLLAEPVPLPDDVQKIPLPSWVEPKIQETFTRFKAWKGQDETVVFPIVTDIHSGLQHFSNPVNYNDPKIHILYAQRAANVFNADFMADLGDNGMDRNTRWADVQMEHGLNRLDANVKIYRGFPKPVLFCVGNHDLGNSIFHIPARKFGELFTGLMIKKGFKFTTGPNLDYGFYDVPQKPLRVFFLNSSETLPRVAYGFEKTQLQFLVRHLQDLPEGYATLILTHFCLHPTIGRWVPDTGRWQPQLIPTLRIILEDFKKCAKGEDQGLKWDFSHNQSNKIIGCISGDSHFDCEAVLNEITYVITQSYGTVSQKHLPKTPPTTYLPFTRTNEMLVDMVAIKLNRQEMKFFRIGIGGEQRDRTFKY